MPFRIAPDIDDEMTGHDDEEMQSFNIILRAYTAALNLNKSRFRYTITGPLRSKQFVLLPPNEINGSPSTYQKHELLALFKTIQANVNKLNRKKYFFSLTSPIIDFLPRSMLCQSFFGYP